MTVNCELFDAGTTIIKVPNESPPGMELAYYRELDMEYDFTDAHYRPQEIRAAVLGTDALVDLEPWPEKFPGVMWVDYSSRHYGPKGGPQINLYHWYQWGDDPDNPAPSPLFEMTDPASHEPFVDRADERSGDLLEMEEIQDRNTSPSEWLRLPTKNETGGCQLLQPATMIQRAQHGASFCIESNHNPLFMPFDLRKPEYYHMMDENGVIIPDDRKEHLMRLMEGGRYKLYLVPAKWRWVATVIATYVYISWFEAFYTQQIFTNAWFNRPPVYPTRHDVLDTSQYPSLEYNGVLYCLDDGVTDGFDRSRGSATLRDWIIDAQWYTMSEVYAFVSNDPVTLALWYYPPEPGDVVLGIGSIDNLTGGEERVWLIQREDVSSRWQNTLIEQYLVPFYVV